MRPRAQLASLAHSAMSHAARAWRAIHSVHTYSPRDYSETMQAATDFPRRHWLTVDDYYRMAEVGILDPEARVELVDGEIIDMAPPGSRHAATVHYGPLLAGA